MDSAWLVLLAMLIGLVVGVGFTVAVVAAQRSSERALALVDQDVPDGVAAVLLVLESAGVVLDPSNTVVVQSPYATALGLVRDRALVQPELVELVDSARRGDTTARELTLSRGPFGDQSLTVTARAALLGVRYVLLLVEDLTESKRLEDARRDFMANISHELKTPIGAIGLLAEALESATSEPDQVARFASRLRSEASRLSSITAEIIELSRLESRDALLEPTLVEVDAVVARAIEQNRVAADAKRIEVARRGGKTAHVTGDEGLLVVAVHNLVANAIQYSPPGSRVGIGVRAHDGVVEIAVADQGVGIDEADLDRVFERFYRVDPARARNTGGTGLGLSIVKHVVQNHGGEVRVWSHPGKGSTFTVRLPEASEQRADALGVETA